MMQKTEIFSYQDGERIAILYNIFVNHRKNRSNINGLAILVKHWLIK